MCSKSHCAKVWAYCSAPGHPICEISLGMFQSSRKVAHSRNILRFAKSTLIFSNERSFFMFFVPLQRLDKIPIELLLFGLPRYHTLEK